MNFDSTGDLPTGTTVLEASAGTGKTYAIVGLATRFIAEGTADVSQLLLVTFSRAATQELRERTRERFSVVSAALADRGSARASGDALIAHLADGSVDEVQTRRRRLLRALADFDAGTIATTHSFCQRMLDSLGIAGEREPNSQLVESVDDTVIQAVDDLYLAMYGKNDGGAPMTPSEALQLGREAVRDRQAALSPDPDDTTEAGMRVRFAAAVREEVDLRKRRSGLRDFDDLLGLLHGVLTHPEHGEAACRRVRDRYRVVLIDEFQDTDPLQWNIIRRAFHGHRTLVLVGDPKQAIYAFRGAEVLSYLDAVRHAESHQELSTNWRTDAGLVAALEHLYGGAALGNDDILVHPVEATNAESRLPGGEPFRLRYLPRTGAGPLGKSGFPAIDVLRARVARDVAAQVVDLLENSEGLVGPGDIAVLVRKRAQITLVQDALQAAGVPSVLTGGTSVFDTSAATDWLRVLQALEAPHRADRLRLAALTPILGRTAESLDAEGETVVAEVGTELRELASLFARAGFAAVFERISAASSLDERLLGRPSGERTITDLRHIGQLLNRAVVEDRLGLTALTRWLADRISDPVAAAATDRSRRLDSDAAAVQIATVHASKGLEFPVVFVPFAWDGAKHPYPSTLLLHGPDGERILDVGGRTGPGYAQRKQLSDREEAGEELRLLYVALTRAKSRVLTWWAPSTATSGSALHRLLLGRVPGAAAPEPSVKVLEDDVMSNRLESWPGDAVSVISVEPVVGEPSSERTWKQADNPSPEVAAARFDRELDMEWRRTSYSALTASAHEGPGVRSEVEQPEKDDEPEGPVEGTPEPDTEVPESLPSPMNGLPAGAAFGTLVHEVLETVDTSAPDLAGELLVRCREAVEARYADVDPKALATALVPVMQTPLGFGRLADIDPSDRLAELDFELPLAGGEELVDVSVTTRDIADLLRRHLPEDDVMAGYPEQMTMLEERPIRGFLTGSIDAVLRIPGPRFVIVDYKTNRLGAGDLTTEHYTNDRMVAEMLRAHYPLQALLYAVALHRYLRWRLPDYIPDEHLGGVRYLFVRGMAGPESPPGAGVFSWDPPPGLVVELSDLLAGRMGVRGS
ncbi:UvrD-helicase domain-containing protein [Rhodococcus sp. NPDC058521]|uniref:UvrD-helicase domain-containing protein n=1 Tax=Rhodococcus sp. NPDC058521 TaxID=3346536 RepID=UPI003653D7B4